MPQDFELLTRKIEELKKKGVKIINVGKVSFENAIIYTKKSKYCVFPTLNETLGLGLVEATIAGAKVLSSNLPFIYDVVEPSLSFDPYNVNDMAEKIKLALSEDLPKPKLRLQNKLNAFIDFLHDTSKPLTKSLTKNQEAFCNFIA